MVRKLWLILLAPLALLMIGCGGGANSDPPDTLFQLLVSMTEDGVADTYAQVEMIKSPASDIAFVRLSGDVINPTNSGRNNTVLHANITSYTMTYKRADGGSTLPVTFTGQLDERVNTTNLRPVFNVVIFPIGEKLTSAFAQDFLNNLLAGNSDPIPLEVTITVRGRTDSGEPVSGTSTMLLDAGVYLPVDELLPSIVNFRQTESLTVGQDYQASWFVNTGRFPIGGQFVLPWGETIPLNSSSFFPAGFISRPTDVFAPDHPGRKPTDPVVPYGSTTEFNTGTLTVGNLFGIVQSTGDSTVSVTNPPLPPDPPDPEPDPVVIEQFAAERSEIQLGDSVNLSVVVSGNVTRVELSPDTFNGQTVILPPDNNVPKIFTISITPEFTVRPLLAIFDDVNGLQASAFLQDPITVVPPVEQPPEVLFFRSSVTNVPLGGRVVFFWRVSGEVEKIELLPINNTIIDVTGRDSYTSPPFNQAGSQTINFIVTPANGGTPIIRSLNLNISEVANEPVEIRDVDQQPSSTIGNDDSGAFSFTIVDPEGADSSWRVAKVAGDAVSFFPLTGRIPDGLGDDAVAFNDRIDSANGFFTFELSAWDDNNFGATVGSNRTVRLITFNTNDTLNDNAPVITGETFTPGAEDNSTGTVSFSYSDPDTLILNWSVRIAAGDFGGSFDIAGGQNRTGGGSESVTYTDDPDTPDADVVFLIRVTEGINVNPQSDIALVQVDKGTGDVTTGVDPTENPISFPFTGLFDNNDGDVNAFDEIGNFNLYFNGDIGGSPQFYKNSDLSDEVNAASFVVDILHSTNDPQSVTDVAWIRDFITPATIANRGDFSFVNFYPNAGSSVGGSATPLDGGVSRWNMLFSVEQFRNSDTNMLNLPSASGTRNYLITVEAQDNQSEQNTVSQILRVTVP